MPRRRTLQGMRLLALAGLALTACVASAPMPEAATPSPSSSAREIAAPATAAATALMTPAVPDPPRAPLVTIAPQYERQLTEADFDCDARLDRLQLVHTGSPSSDTWRATLELANGATASIDVAGLPLTRLVFATPDIDLDGCADAALAIGNGASTTWVAFLTYHSGALREVTSGDPYGPFLVGGSVRHGDSIDCRRGPYGPELVWRSVSDYTSETSWDVVERVYRWPTPGTLALAYVVRGEIAVAHPYEQPADARRLWGFNCGAPMG